MKNKEGGIGEVDKLNTLTEAEIETCGENEGHNEKRVD
jgi:hypothetical protein